MIIISINNIAMNYKKKKRKILKSNLLNVRYVFSIQVSIVQSFIGANNCGTVVLSDDPYQSNAIQCCHQSEQFN